MKSRIEYTNPYSKLDINCYYIEKIHCDSSNVEPCAMKGVLVDNVL